MASNSAPAGQDPWNDESKSKFEAKSRSEYFDPCQEAASKSIKCLHRNGGDRSMCGDYFQAYRDCKKLWVEKRREERRKNGWFFTAASER